MIDYTHNTENGTIEVVTPYDKDFVTKARNLRGKWDAKNTQWIFDDSIAEYVKDALIEVYGTTGEKPVDTCTLVITDFSEDALNDAVELFGRRIAKAWGRDSGARLGDDIIWIKGNYDSAGSVKNWRTEVENATFEIQNFLLPRTLKEDVQEAIREGWCTIKESKKPKRTEEQIQADIDKYEAILIELKNELRNI